jgi:hypothetical protein
MFLNVWAWGGCPAAALVEPFGHKMDGKDSNKSLIYKFFLTLVVSLHPTYHGEAVEKAGYSLRKPSGLTASAPPTPCGAGPSRSWSRATKGFQREYPAFSTASP